MSKLETDDLLQIKISVLKPMLKTGQRGAWSLYTWTDKRTGKQNSVGINIFTGDPIDNYMILKYTETDRAGLKQDFDYRVNLDITPCHFGGIRYWFKCPGCNRRVAILYSGGIYACRRCKNLCYHSQKENNNKRPPMYREFYLECKIERLEKKIMRPYYKGKPTRKQKMLLRLRQKRDAIG